jgi:hypothetical protein
LPLQAHIFSMNFHPLKRHTCLQPMLAASHTAFDV